MLISQPVFSPGSFILSNPKRASISSVNWLRSSRLRADKEDPSSLVQTHATVTLNPHSPRSSINILNKKVLWSFWAAGLTGFPDPHSVLGPLCSVHCSAEPSSIAMFWLQNTKIKQLNVCVKPHLKTRRFNFKVLSAGFLCACHRLACCFPILARSCSCRERTELRTGSTKIVNKRGESLTVVLRRIYLGWMSCSL